MNKLIIFDNKEYKKYRDTFGNADVLFTEYETPMIRKVRNFRIIGSFLYHILMWKVSYDYANEVFKKNYEKIICINPLVGIFLGLKNKKKSTSIIFSGFLFEPKENKLYYDLRKRIVELSLANISEVIVYSSKEVRYYQSIFPKYKEKFKFIHYGMDYDDSGVYNGDLPKDYIFSGGGSNRDYSTLIRAFEKAKIDSKLVIASQPWKVPYTTDERIRVLSDVVVENFGDVMKHSKILILSLKDTDISAGHMVMLQAMKLGVPIIVNDIPAVRDYVDDSIVTFYESGNIDELASIIENYDTDIDKIDKARSVYNTKYTLKSLIERLFLA
ncbi:TPA: glycosyltransferase [Streptococcus suis]